MEAVPQLDKESSSLEMSAESNETPVQHLRSRYQAFAYLMGSDSGKVFRLELFGKTWCGKNNESLVLSTRGGLPNLGRQTIWRKG